MPANQPKTLAEIVAQRLDAILAKFASDIAHGVPSTPEDLRELKNVINARLVMETGEQIESLPYAQFKNATDAALAHLEQSPGKLSREELAQSILMGGWGRDQPGREHKARVAISYSISRTGRIVERGGKLYTTAQIELLDRRD